MVTTTTCEDASVPSPSTEVTVEGPVDIAHDSRGEDEWIAVSSTAVSTLGLSVGQQCRLAPTGNGQFESATYTISESYECPDPEIQCESGAMERLGLSNGSTAYLVPWAVHPEYESRLDAARFDEFVELSNQRSGSDTCVLAPHGGNIEYGTDQQAAAFGEQAGASDWRCVGFNDGPGSYDRWHITSVDISPESFPQLASLSAPFQSTVALHGYSGSGVLVAGLADQSRKESVTTALQGHLPDEEITLISGTDSYGATNPANIINWLAAGEDTIQLEQSWTVRNEKREAVVSALLDVYGG
ncbi:poly-gamma-glutamate hydrolase family protein [Haloarchaeobius baliensis]|uniref:poly-gamma-glutamate hydrolase family protein n=1 Tax=Haloarchaeobius baliensis TaxID=1670458 RepID=UPI003F884377